MPRTMVATDSYHRFRHHGRRWAVIPANPQQESALTRVTRRLECPSGTLVFTMSSTAAPLLDDPTDLSALRAKGGDADELFSSFAAWAEAQGTVLYPAQEEALIELV